MRRGYRCRNPNAGRGEGGKWEGEGAFCPFSTYILIFLHQKHVFGRFFGRVTKMVWKKNISELWPFIQTRQYAFHWHKSLGVNLNVRFKSSFHPSPSNPVNVILKMCKGPGVQTRLEPNSLTLISLGKIRKHDRVILVWGRKQDAFFSVMWFLGYPI